MKFYLQFTIASLAFTGLPAFATSWTNVVNCNGGRLAIDSAKGPFSDEYQFVFRNSEDQNKLLWNQAVLNPPFNGEIILGGLGTGTTRFNNGTYFFTVYIPGSSEKNSYYVYPTGSNTYALDAYRSQQTGISTWSNLRKLVSLSFTDCK